MVGGSGGPGDLAVVRGEWLDDALDRLVGDARVVGVALVGSLGRGEADEWSDVDLLVVVDDRQVAPFVDPAQNRLWDDATLLFDARQNAPAGATSLGTVYVRRGLPLGVDWYVHPVSTAAWPSDCRVVHETAALPQIDEPFAAFNARGRRQAGTSKTADDVRQAQLAMALVAGKYIARRSPAAVEMIRLVVGATQAVGPSPADQLQMLRAAAARLSLGASADVADAIESYLGIVESTIA